MGSGLLHRYRPEGEITVRPATIPEREKSTRASVRSEEDALHEADDEMRKRHAAANPDGLLVPLDETEEEDEAP
jgi:hypothetical protein